MKNKTMLIRVGITAAVNCVSARPGREVQP